MRARTHVAAVSLLALLLAACSATRSTPMSSGGAATPRGKTITIGVTRIDPDDLTMTHDETLSFMSTADHPLTIEFTQPKDQADRIKCHVTDPKLAKGEAAWATFRTNSEGHLTADVPGGLFPSVCTLAPGSYTYIVKMLDPGLREAPGRLGQQGTITVK